MIYKHSYSSMYINKYNISLYILCLFIYSLLLYTMIYKISIYWYWLDPLSCLFSGGVTDVMVLGIDSYFIKGIVNSCMGHKALTDDEQSDSKYGYDAHLFKLTTGSTNYYVNKDEKYSEEQKRAVQTLIQSTNKTKVVLGICIFIRNGSLEKGMCGYEKQVDFLNAHLENLNTYSVVVLLNKV